MAQLTTQRLGVWLSPLTPPHWRNWCVCVCVSGMTGTACDLEYALILDSMKNLKFPALLTLPQGKGGNLGKDNPHCAIHHFLQSCPHFSWTGTHLQYSLSKIWLNGTTFSFAADDSKLWSHRKRKMSKQQTCQHFRFPSAPSDLSSFCIWLH